MFQNVHMYTCLHIMFNVAVPGDNKSEKQIVPVRPSVYSGPETKINLPCFQMKKTKYGVA